MKQAQRPALRWLVVAALLITAIWAWRWHELREQAHAPGAGSVPIAGGDGGGLPRATADEERFDAQALRAAAALAVQQHALALLVMRDGHLVHEQYGGGTAADMLVAGGALSALVARLAAGIAVASDGLVMPPPGAADSDRLADAIAAVSHMSYPQFLSRRLWQPLNAAPARWRAGELSARPADWLRIGELLAHDGRFEGTQVVPAGWVQRFVLPRQAAGSEPFAARDLSAFHGPGATRLWVVPRLALVVLRVADAAPDAPVDETGLVNMVVRAARDGAAGGGATLNDLVPGH